MNKSFRMIIRSDKSLRISSKAKSREFTGNKNKAVNEMIQTLRKEPENFRFNNLGIRMVATDNIRNCNLA